MSNFSTRFVSALVYAAIFIFSIAYSSYTYIGLITLFGAVCIWEFSKIIQLKNAALPVVALVTIIVAQHQKILDTNKLVYLLIFCVLYLSVLAIRLYQKKKKELNPFLKPFVTICYLVLPFFFLTYLPFLKSEYQPELIIYIILIIWSNDSFAYIIGKNFGKRKLFERISPKKTIEGFVGGFVFAILTGIIVSQFSTILTIQNWIIIAVITSIFGTFGDLVESKFKRQAKVKDSGTIMPGHGGLLDRLDSLFFLAPFVYLYVHYLV